MFLFYVLSFFKNEDIIQGGTLFKGGHQLRKYGMYCLQIEIERLIRNACCNRKLEVIPLLGSETKFVSY